MFNKVFSPMLLKEVDKPFNDSNYIYELKYDGIRVLVHVSKNSLKVITRNGIDVSKQYPELYCLKKIVGSKKVIFDGEIVAFCNGLPSFNQLSFRSHLKSSAKIKQKMEEIPICFIAFDILYQNKNLMDIPLIERKQILNMYNDTDFFIKSKVYSDGLKLFQKVKKIGLEGIIAKEKNSLYIPNKRVYFWLKIKNFKADNFLIHGFTKLKDKYSLLLGEYRGKKLYSVGKVSVIEKHPIIEILKKEKETNNQFVNLDSLDVKYVEPKHKIKVHYMERTDNDSLRQPFIKNKKKP